MVELFEYETGAIREVAKLFEIDVRITRGFAESLHDLKKLFRELGDQEVADLRQGTVVLMGLANHTQQLLVGGLIALANGNAHVWSACARGLIETFGACVLIADSPPSAPNYLLDQVKAGKLRAAAERARPGLGADLDRLNSIVHPASSAIHEGFEVLDRDSGAVRFWFGCRIPPRNEGTEAVTVLANLAVFIVEKLETLARTAAVTSAGKIVMRRDPSLDGGA